jgi:hypothetical protein
MAHVYKITAGPNVGDVLWSEEFPPGNRVTTLLSSIGALTPGMEIEHEFPYGGGRACWRLGLSSSNLYSAFEWTATNPRSDTIPETPNTPACECGARKTFNLQDFALGHASYCPVRKV